jgi:glyoxylase-like metal-dependent hydrolase (beta-lactamase superfamily II)
MKREGGPAPVQPATTGGVPAAPAAAAEDTLEVMPLGGGAEVGRSCILLRFKGKQVLLDCGVHPAYTGQEGLPFFDMIDDISQIDLLLVTHFHLDHVGSLPYFLEKTSFQGRVFMTHPTKAVYKMLMRLQRTSLSSVFCFTCLQRLCACVKQRDGGAALHRGRSGAHDGQD